MCTLLLLCVVLYVVFKVHGGWWVFVGLPISPAAVKNLEIFKVEREEGRKEFWNKRKDLFILSHGIHNHAGRYYFFQSPTGERRFSFSGCLIKSQKAQ